MSQMYRSKIAQLLAQKQSLGMTNDEKKDILGWCPISDRVVRDLMREQGIRGNIDSYIEKLSDADIKDIHAKVMQLYRARKKRRGSTIKMLRREGTGHANAQADKLEEEQRRDDERAKEIEAAEHT